MIITIAFDMVRDLVAVHRAVAARRRRRARRGARRWRRALRGIAAEPDAVGDRCWARWPRQRGMRPARARSIAPIAMLADAASPVALFTIGAVLARSAMLAREHARAPVAARWGRRPAAAHGACATCCRGAAQAGGASAAGAAAVRGSGGRLGLPLWPSRPDGRWCWWRRCRARATCRCWPSASARTTAASPASSCGRRWRPSCSFRWWQPAALRAVPAEATVVAKWLRASARRACRGRHPKGPRSAKCRGPACRRSRSCCRPGRTAWASR